MVNIYGRSSSVSDRKRKDAINLSKYATKDELYALFQDKYGVLKTSNIKWIDMICRDLGATRNNTPVFTDRGRIRDSNVSIATIRNEIIKSVSDRLRSTGDTMTDASSIATAS
ncbi:hypothetical protein CHS0354_028645 [Potamilus streckersoni]|uniref:Uncharacterized protein n=1 Tax=Potamilus streckersoni TaxID=2493646 RepID=A0AAE0SWD6_9BIVA|nr:hypothetical protein CHS0354_028645 [Potamilus streckersoni]